MEKHKQALAVVSASLVALGYQWWRLRKMLPLGTCASLPGSLPTGDQQVMLPSNGLTRYIYRPGDGKTTSIIVLIHGISYPGVDIWRDLIDAFEGRSVLAYDLTGRGYSHSSGEPMTVDVYINQLEELLNALGCQDRSLELVGWSLGGVIASTFAHRHPGRVGKLVMLATAGLFPGTPPGIEALRAASRVERARFAQTVPATLKQRYAYELRGMADGGQLWRALCRHVDNNSALVRSYLSTALDCPELFDNRAVLRAVGKHAMPTLFIFAKVDHAVGSPPDARPPDEETLRELMPKAVVRVVDAPDIDHALHLTHRAVVEPLLVRFLADGSC